MSSNNILPDSDKIYPNDPAIKWNELYVRPEGTNSRVGKSYFPPKLFREIADTRLKLYEQKLEGLSGLTSKVIRVPVTDLDPVPEEVKKLADEAELDLFKISKIIAYNPLDPLTPIVFTPEDNQKHTKERRSILNGIVRLWKKIVA